MRKAGCAGAVNDKEVHMGFATRSGYQASSEVHPSPGLLLQRKCACGQKTKPGEHCEKCEEEGLSLKRRGLGPAAPLAIPSIVHEVVSSPGNRLDAGARSFFEPRFGHDFSGVRVHTDARAAESAGAVNALAYTVGPHLVFAANQYAPGTGAGKKLLAHELAHVVQQASGSAGSSSGIDKGASDPAEQAADRRAEQVLSATGAANSTLRELSFWPRTAIQRYTVPSSLPCDEVVEWLNNNSPYKPEWAQTSCDYTFEGDLKTTPPAKTRDGVSITAKGHSDLKVSVDCPIDRPEWDPSKRPGRDAEVTAWNNMRRQLDAHEKEHQKIGETWRKKKQKLFRAVNITATGADETEARDKLVEKIAAEQEKWRAAAQSDQDKIDPFRGANLACPEPTAMEESAPGPDYAALGLLPPTPAKLGEAEGAPAPAKSPSPEIEELSKEI